MFFANISKMTVTIVMKFCVLSVLIDTYHLAKTACPRIIWFGLYSSWQTPFFETLSRFLPLLCEITQWQSDAVVWTNWTLDKICASYIYLKLKKKISKISNFFSKKNWFKIFFVEKNFPLFFPHISQIKFSPIFWY